uniref:Uncharacterized protein n=1 Tax=Calidris pygmaea TaxID=425635 RepID=A0A8C3J3N2_9CHAR
MIPFPPFVFPLYRSSKETLQNKAFLLGYYLTTYFYHVIKITCLGQIKEKQTFIKRLNLLLK